MAECSPGEIEQQHHHTNLKEFTAAYHDSLDRARLAMEKPEQYERDSLAPIASRLSNLLTDNPENCSTHITITTYNPSALLLWVVDQLSRQL